MKKDRSAAVYLPPAGLLYFSDHLHDHVKFLDIVEGRASVFSEEADIGVLGIGVYVCGHHMSSSVDEDFQ